MLKQLACAAASNSSGVVCAGAPSVRAFQLRFNDLNVPLSELVLPLPDNHIAFPRRGRAALHVRSSFEERGLYTLAARRLTERAFRCIVFGSTGGLRPIRTQRTLWALERGRIPRRDPGCEARGVTKTTPARSSPSNDSPDVGFSWSVNPYRGCFHACAYCLAGDTQILMGDGSLRPIRKLAAGDEIYGTVVRGNLRRYTCTPGFSRIGRQRNARSASGSRTEPTFSRAKTTAS